MAEPKNVELSMVRGDTFAFDVVFEDLEVEIVSVDFSVKKNAKDDEYVVHEYLGEGVTLIEENKYRVRVAPEDTRGVQPGKYVYDLQIGAGADVYTLLLGTIRIIGDVTGN